GSQTLAARAPHTSVSHRNAYRISDRRASYLSCLARVEVFSCNATRVDVRCGPANASVGFCVSHVLLRGAVVVGPETVADRDARLARVRGLDAQDLALYLQLPAPQGQLPVDRAPAARHVQAARGRFDRPADLASTRCLDLVREVLQDVHARVGGVDEV